MLLLLVFYCRIDKIYHSASYLLFLNPCLILILISSYFLFLVSCLEVNTNGNENIERTPPSVTINEKDLGSPQITQQHAPPFPPPDRAVEKDKDKGERGKTGGQ